MERIAVKQKKEKIFVDYKMIKTLDDIEKTKPNWTSEDVESENSLSKSFNEDFAKDKGQELGASQLPVPDKFKLLKDRLNREIRNLGRSNLISKQKIIDIIKEVEYEK